jgi:hypothetical protein
MSLNFLLIEISFLAVVLCFCAVNSDFLHQSIHIFKEKKSLNKFFNPDGFCFLSQDMLWWLGMMAHKAIAICEATPFLFLRSADHLDMLQINFKKDFSNKRNGRPSF